MVTIVQNIIYHGTKFAEANVNGMSGNNYSVRPFSINNNPKSISFQKFSYKFFFFLIFFLLMGKYNIQAQENSNYALYANIIYRFTKYVNWPGGKKSGDFIIGVAGDSPLYDELKTFTANKWVGNQKIVIKQFLSSEEFFKCQILFITANKSSSMKKIASATTNASTLLISESEGLARKGSCINFIIVDDHLKLEINKKNIEERNLDVASELFDLGVAIK